MKGTVVTTVYLKDSTEYIVSTEETDDMEATVVGIRDRVADSLKSERNVMWLSDGKKGTAVLVPFDNILYVSFRKEATAPSL